MSRQEVVVQGKNPPGISLSVFERRSRQESREPTRLQCRLSLIFNSGG